MTELNWDTLTIEQLRQHATEHNIDLTGLTLKAEIIARIVGQLDAAAPSKFPDVVVDALVSADIDVDTVQFWRLERDRLAIGHIQNGTLVGSKIPLTDDQIVELLELDETGGKA
jgi:hypothetical protein